jgi:hypothetical protein
MLMTLEQINAVSADAFVASLDEAYALSRKGTSMRQAIQDADLNIEHIPSLKVIPRNTLACERLDRFGLMGLGLTRGFMKRP